MGSGRVDVSYVLPLRWSEDSGLGELQGYIRGLTAIVNEVIVVDGSAPPLFARHAAALEEVRHLAPDPALRTAMGKVGGVATGVLAAGSEKVVIADDDVRYDAESLRRIAAALDTADLVRPQNYFAPLPWHAKIDTARSLLNRVHSGDIELGAGDFPGTLGLRRGTFLAAGGYDGDVIFENLELMRTVAAAGGRVSTELDLYVRRLPPSASHYFSQRVRQAYDDFALPLRMAVLLSVLPLIAVAAVTRRGRALVGGAALVSGAAEAGRRRAGGRGHFSAASSLLAPVWLLERAVSVWIAVWRKVARGGVRYGDVVLERSASSSRELRARARRPGGLEANHLVGAVAERVEAGTPAAADRDRSPS